MNRSLIGLCADTPIMIPNGTMFLLVVPHGNTMFLSVLLKKTSLSM